MEALGDEEHIMRNKEKYNTLAEKAREMGYKVEYPRSFFGDCLMWLFHSHEEKYKCCAESFVYRFKICTNTFSSLFFFSLDEETLAGFDE